MDATKEALKERIKELTCLYEVSSIIANADFDQVQETFAAIAYSLKKGFQFPEQTEIAIDSKNGSFKTKLYDNLISLSSTINVFNKPNGSVIAYLSKENSTFLNEEKQLLDTVALKLGNLIERLEIQQNEISLKRQMERADRLSILGEITAGIAHELNTPLANILGFAELLKEDHSNKNGVTDDLDKIIKNAIFSREVVKKLLFFSCEMPQEIQHVNLVPQVKSALTLLDASFKKAQVNYVLKVVEEELFIKADTIQLTQIIFNLVINAIYFSPIDGVVTIDLYHNEHYVFISITDQGPGLGSEALEKIFQPFFTTKPTGDGSGLGLSVVHGIVSSHKGTITVQNIESGGAIFTVKLPKSL